MGEGARGVPYRLSNWINSRPTANENPHTHTLIMIRISLRMHKGELL